MIYRIQKALLNQPIWAILILVFIILLGSYGISQLSIDAVPDITGIQVMVQTKTGSMDPEQSESLVTYPLEIELSGIQKVQEIRSITKFGLSLITVVFEDDMDLYLARQLISERLQTAQKGLPEKIVPQLGPISTGLSEVYMYTIDTNENIQTKEKLLKLRTIHDWIIRPQLKTIEGIAEVDVNGGFTKGVFIEFIPEKLYQYGIGPKQFLNTIQNIGEVSGGGYIETDGKRLIVTSDNRFFGLEQIRNFPLRIYAIGPSIKLKDLSNISEKELPRIGAATHNGEEIVLGNLLMRIGENSRKVVENIEEKLLTLFKPKNLELKTLYSRSYLVDETISTVKKNLFEGAIFVIVILFLLLGNFRAAFLVSIAIPLSMLIAFFGMAKSKISANLMSLGAIDFGLIVDGSVVMIENIIRNFESYKDTKSKNQIILQSLKEITPSIITGISIIIIVYFPIFFLVGVEGKLFKPMAETIIFALIGSLFIAIFIMPVLALIFIPIKKHKSSFSITHILKKIYKPTLIFSLKWGWYILVSILFLWGISLYIFYKMPAEFVSNLDEQDLVIGIVRNPDISLEEMIEKQKLAEKLILEFPEVKHVFSRIGIPESATDPMGINFADTFIILEKDKSKWRKHDKKPITKQDLFFLIKKKLEATPELRNDEISPTQPIEMRFNEMLEGSRADISLRIFGPDLDVLYDLIIKARLLLEENMNSYIKEITQDELSALNKTPILQFKNLPYNLEYYGITHNDINAIFENSLGGSEIGYYFEDNKKFPIIFRMHEANRNNIKLLKKLPVDLPEGGVISLDQLANLEIKEKVTTISRINTQRYAALSVYLKTRDVEGFVKKADPLIKELLKEKSNYYIEWAGQYKNLQRAKYTMYILIPLTILMIFLILYQNIKMLRQTLLILVSIPFASIGGILLLWFREIPFSVSTSVGFIALSGIVILNGTVLINFFNELRKKNPSEEILNIVIEGTLIRLRPVLMTALVAILGFLPMAINTGIGSEVQRPLATIVIGGLFTSTVLTLLILPFLYYKTEEFVQKVKQKNNSV
ncbi:MAG: efflux RND transporter permease subunit [Leptonema sp. (in: bacteria)]